MPQPPPAPRAPLQRVQASPNRGPGRSPGVGRGQGSPEDLGDRYGVPLTPSGLLLFRKMCSPQVGPSGAGRSPAPHTKERDPNRILPIAPSEPEAALDLRHRIVFNAYWAGTTVISSVNHFLQISAREPSFFISIRISCTLSRRATSSLRKPMP